MLCLGLPPAQRSRMTPKEPFYGPRERAVDWTRRHHKPGERVPIRMLAAAATVLVLHKVDPGDADAVLLRTRGSGLPVNLVLMALRAGMTREKSAWQSTPRRGWSPRLWRRWRYCGHDPLPAADQASISAARPGRRRRVPQAESFNAKSTGVLVAERRAAHSGPGSRNRATGRAPNDPRVRRHTLGVPNVVLPRSTDPGVTDRPLDTPGSGQESCPYSRAFPSPYLRWVFGPTKMLLSYISLATISAWYPWIRRLRMFSSNTVIARS